MEILLTETDAGLPGPDDRYLAVTRLEFQTPPQVNPFPYTRAISMIDIEAGQELPLVQVTIPDIDVEIGLQTEPIEWSLDSHRLYYWKGTGGPFELWQVDVTTLEHEYIATLPGQSVPYCDFLSPDGQWVLCEVVETRSPRQYAVVCVPIGSGQAEGVVSGASNRLYTPTWHPAGQEVTINLPPKPVNERNCKSSMCYPTIRGH